MKSQTNLLVLSILAGLFFVLSILSVIFPQGPAEINRVAFFFSAAMANVFGWTVYTLKVTSRKIEELHTELEELKRKLYEAGLTL